MKNFLLLLFFLIIHLVSVNAQLPYQIYYGNLHSHTGYSDGVQTPTDAYIYARDSAGLDFLAVTDHLDFLDSIDYQQINNMAAQATLNGTFVAICGYEWTSNVYGHADVFNTTDLVSTSTYTDWDAFTSWMTDRPFAFAQFNHPGRNIEFNNWNNFDYIDALIDTSFSLIEFQNIQQATDWYELALNKGWHLSPVWNQDNHTANWGNKNNGRAGIWATNLSVNSIFDAIRAGRTFATMDKNASVWLEVFGNPMGNTIDRIANMPLKIKLSDADNESWQNIELVTSNGVVMSFSSAGNLDTLIPLNLLDDKYVFVRAIQADSDYVWSSPIYIVGSIMQTNNLSDYHFSIYPNPANRKIYIEFAQKPSENTFIRIITLDGKVIKEAKVSYMTGNILKFDLPEKINGLVLVEIEIDKVKYFYKLSVMR